MICYYLLLLNIFNIYTITVMNQCMLTPILNILATPIFLLMLTRVTTTPNRGAPLRARLR